MVVTVMVVMVTVTMVTSSIIINNALSHACHAVHQELAAKGVLSQDKASKTVSGVCSVLGVDAPFTGEL